MYQLLPEKKRDLLPTHFVNFLGYTIYNAKKYTGQTKWNLAQAHLNYAQKIPSTINTYIEPSVREHLTPEMVEQPIGGTAVMHTHNTLPNMAQKYRAPIWDIPNLNLEGEDKSTIMLNAKRYKATKKAYEAFAHEFIARLNLLP